MEELNQLIQVKIKLLVGRRISYTLWKFLRNTALSLILAATITASQPPVNAEAKVLSVNPQTSAAQGFCPPEREMPGWECVSTHIPLLDCVVRTVPFDNARVTCYFDYPDGPRKRVFSADYPTIINPSSYNCRFTDFEKSIQWNVRHRGFMTGNDGYPRWYDITTTYMVPVVFDYGSSLWGWDCVNLLLFSVQQRQFLEYQGGGDYVFYTKSIPTPIRAKN